MPSEFTFLSSLCASKKDGNPLSLATVEKINNTAHEKGQGVKRADSATNYHAVFHVKENGELSLDPWCENYTWLNYMDAVNQLVQLDFMRGISIVGRVYSVFRM